MSNEAEHRKVTALQSIAATLKEQNRILATLNENFVALVNELKNADVVIEATLVVADNKEVVDKRMAQVLGRNVPTTEGEQNA